MIFSDEKKWVLVGGRSQWVWRPVGTRYYPQHLQYKTQGNGGSLMVWGAAIHTFMGSWVQGHPIITVCVSAGGCNGPRWETSAPFPAAWGGGRLWKLMGEPNGLRMG